MSKRNIYIMYIISLLQGMVFYAPVATLYRQVHGVTIFQITLIESISLALCMVLELPWGIIADRIGYKKTVLFCNVLYFLSKIVFWKADSFTAFLLERVMLSVVCAGLSGVDSSILYLSCEEGQSRKVFGIYDGLGTAGLLFTSMIYSLFVKDCYELAGFFTVISYGIAMTASFFLIEIKETVKRPQDGEKFSEIFRKIIKRKELYLFLLGIGIINETHQTVTVFLSQLLYVRAGIGSAVMGILYGVITVVALVSIFADRVAEWLGEIRLIRSCFILFILSCLILAITKKPFFVMLGIVFLRAGFSLMSPLQMELQNRQVDVADRATVLSVNSIFMNSVGVGANVVFGVFAEFSLSGALFFGMIICVLSWILFELWNVITKGCFLARKRGCSYE